jgi:membrane protein
VAYWALAWRTFNRVREHDCVGLAAQAAFSAIVSLVPAFICLVAVTSTIGVNEESLQFVVSSLAGLLPAGSSDVVDVTIRAAVESPAPGLLTTSLALTLWSASGALATYTKGLNRAYGVEPRFAYWRNRAVAVVLVLLVAVPIGLAAVATLFGRPIARYVVAQLALGPLEAVVWGTLRWLATFTIVVMVVWLIYLVAPSYRAKPLDALPGAVVATALWALVSIAFNLFTASRFTHYQIYGGLAALVVFLFWVHLSSLALLVGAELNAELESARRGGPRDVE